MFHAWIPGCVSPVPRSSLQTRIWAATCWSESFRTYCIKFESFMPQYPISLVKSLLSLCAASRMWVKHRSVVIVPSEGGLEFRWDSEMCWCFIHVTIKLVLGTTQRSVIESCFTHVSSSPRETVLREICFLVDLDRRKKMRRVCLLDSRCVFLSFSSPTSLPYPSVAQKEHTFSADT